MALSTYAELQTAIDNWLDHQLFSARSPDFIAMFEATANRRLRVRDQETQASLVPSAVNGAIVLPTDYLSWRHVTWLGSVPRELEYVTPGYIEAAYPSTATGDARAFTIEGLALKVRPISATALRFDYFQKIPSLSDAAPTNWLLTAHPDIYLFGSLVEAELFGANDERAPVWKARRDEIFTEIEMLSNKTRGAGAVKVFGPTP